MAATSHDVWKFVNKLIYAEGRRIRHCRGCIYLGSVGHRGCCNYWEIEDRLRPCKPGRGCTVKIVTEGYQFPAWWDEYVKKADAEDDERARKKAEKAAQTNAHESVDVMPRSDRGKKAKWDVDYALKLYRQGYYVHEIADVVGVSFFYLSSYINNHGWSVVGREKLKQHDVARAIEEYREFKNNENNKCSNRNSDNNRKDVQNV